MEENSLIYALEAVLFASGDPVSADRLCDVLGIDREALEELAATLADFYEFERRGFKLIRLDNKYQLVSRPEYSEYVRRALESGKPAMLSPSAMEVLAIIAYKQPVTRTYVEQVRGVDSAYTLSSLVDKGMVESCGRLDVPGRPLLYKTSDKFLRSFGLSGLDQLPFIENFNIAAMDPQLTIEDLPEETPPEGEAE